MIINCTPHNINICENGQIVRTISPSNVVPRLSQSTEDVGEIDGIRITKTAFGETQDLPEYKENTYLIVSRLVMSANPHRTDLLVPNGIVRDSEGNIIGCESLSQN